MLVSVDAAIGVLAHTLSIKTYPLINPVCTIAGPERTPLRSLIHQTWDRALTIDIAFSPCPNDTFTFHAWVNGLLTNAPRVKAHLTDIQQLNEWAVKQNFPLIKVSFGALPTLLDRYRVLPSGAALGHNCGPKLVGVHDYTLKDLSQLRVAIPGRDTTAKLLMDLLCPRPAEIVDAFYHEIPLMLQEGRFDAGLVIHETRFCLEELGLTEIADLGELWEARYNVPVPLGCIIVRRDLDLGLSWELNRSIQDSLCYAFQHPEASAEYVRENAQELSPEITQAHIDLYVTEESLRLSTEAQTGIQQLLELAAQRSGIAFDLKDWLLEIPTPICH